MLSIANISSKHASNYYTTGDYYGNKDVRPEWFGKGAEKLKLLGKEFDKADFENILNGKTILDGEEISLCNNRKEHASGIDLTFSAPKSVSVVCELKDKKIQELHEIAVKNTLEYIEKDFIYRRTKNEDGKFVKRMDNMIATLFTENTSRALDPQLHTHCVVYNITFDENDKAGSAFFKDIFNNKKFLGFIYRNELANQLRKEGYEIEFDAKRENFEIKGVNTEIINLFSTRSSEIKQKLEELGLTDYADGKIKAGITKITRKTKAKYISMDKLKSAWKFQLDINGLNLENVAKNNNINRKNISINYHIRNSIDHLSERNSIFTREDVIKNFEKNNFGKASISEIYKELTTNKDYCLFFNAPLKEYSTYKQISMETDIIKLMKEGQNTLERIKLDKNIEEYNTKTYAYKTLNNEQKETVNFVLNTKDRIIAIQGFAGVGKTYAIRALNEILSENNFKLVGLAPTNKAVKTLATEANIEAQTMQRFLKKYDGYANNRGTDKGLKRVKEKFKNTILLLDESSLADTAQIKNLITIANKLDVRVVLQGDKMQLDAVNAGSPFRQMQKNGISQTEMRNIQRQKNLDIKEAVYDTINQDIKDVFKRLDKNIIEIEKTTTISDIVNMIKNIDSSIKDDNINKIISGKKAENLIVNIKAAEKYISTLEQKSKKEINKFNIIKTAIEKQWKIAEQKNSIGNLKYEMAETVVKQYMDLSKKDRKNTLIITPSNETKDSINFLLRQELLKEYKLENERTGKTEKFFGKIKDFLIGQDILFDKNISVIEQQSLTNAEKKYKNNYKIKDIIIFNKNYKKYGIELNKEYEVEKIDSIKNEIIIKNIDDKKEIKLNIDRAKNFDVFRIKNLPFQKGDQLKWTKDFKELSIEKSDAIELTSITETSLTFKDKNTGKEISFTKNDPKLKYLDYNYTTTTYSAQGMTSKNIIVPIESYRTNLTSQKSFYVELSRAKDNITLIVDNKDRVIEQLLNKTGENVNALEIFDKTRTNDSLNRKMGLNNKINKTIEPIKTISNDSYISKHIQNEIEFDK